MKLKKEFALSDSTVNVHGYRLLTSGYQMGEFSKNPIGYHMHNRDAGVLVKWDGLRISGDVVYGTPVINMSNARASQTISEVENGFLNGASFGHFVVLEATEDPKFKLPGQTGPTITKWYNRECSLVDIPGNMGALVLYSNEGNVMDVKSLKALADGRKLIQTSKETVQPQQPQSKASPDTSLIRQMLVIAINDKDINEDTALQLEKAYNEDQNSSKMDINATLKSLANLRIDYLMSLSWAEIDKSNEISYELQSKYLTGWRLKRYLEFGKKKGGSIDNEAFLKFAIAHGYEEDKPINDFKYSEAPTLNQPQVFDRIYNQIIFSTKCLIEKLWDDLSPNELARLKEEAFTSYKKKYFEKFKILCKEPFQVKQLNK